MRPSRILALAVLGPLILGLGGLVGHERLQAWVEQEPIWVSDGAVGTPLRLQDATLEVTTAHLQAAELATNAPSDVPEGAQIVTVNVRLSDFGDEPVCSFELEATVDGERSRWASDLRAGDFLNCQAHGEPIAGVVGFVLPAGTVSEARVLAAGTVPWTGVPLSL